MVSANRSVPFKARSSVRFCGVDDDDDDDDDDEY